MTRYMVVSNPPHRGPDHVACAQSLGVSVAESRMKTNFVAPEIWQVFGDEVHAKDSAADLERAGLAVVTIEAPRLREVPAQRPVTRFTFVDSGLVATLPEGPIEVPYDARLVGVYCKAPPAFAAKEATRRSTADTMGRRTTSILLDRVGGARERGGARVSDALELGAFLDLYASLNGSLTRVTIAQDVTDFSGLGEVKRLGAGDNMSFVVSECARRFPALRLDRRLENVKPRGRLSVASPPPPGGRRLLSFGTLALSEFLASISVDLRYLTQFELGSRLAYVMAPRA